MKLMIYNWSIIIGFVTITHNSSLKCIITTYINTFETVWNFMVLWIISWKEIQIDHPPLKVIIKK